MIQKIKRPLSILLSIMMVVSLFTIVPITASAAEETSTVTWDNNSLQKSSGGKASGGVTLTTTQGDTRVNDCFYNGRGSATFTAPEGSVFTKIELKNAGYVNSLNFPGATVANDGGYWDTMDPEDPEWVPYYTVTWTGESSEVTFSGAIYGIQSIVFTLKSTPAPELPDVIKDCTYQNNNQQLYANVPFTTKDQLAALADGALYANHDTGTNSVIVYDAKGYSYHFYDKNGTEIECTVGQSASGSGSDFGLSDDLTVYAYDFLTPTTFDNNADIYIVATAPEPTTEPATEEPPTDVPATEPAAEPIFVKATSADEFTADNMGSCTYDQAKAWAEANLDTLKAERDAVGGSNTWVWIAYAPTSPTGKYSVFTIDGGGKFDTSSDLTGDIDAFKFFLNEGDIIYYVSNSAEPATEEPTTEEPPTEPDPADDVKDLINALPTTVTVNDKAQIEAARAAYEALSDDEKAKIDTDTLSKLTDAETALEAAEKAAADQAAADPVIAQINALPADVTLDDKAAVDAARQAYNDLTDDQKNLVTDETLEKLAAAEAAIADLEAAKSVTDQINALPADITLNDKAAVDAARQAYTDLTDDQQALVTTETIDKLIAAEMAISNLEAAKAVTDQINALPTVIILEDKADVEAARAAYNDLTDDQKNLVTDETLEKLAAAETAIADLEAAKAVTDQINALPTVIILEDKADVEAARAAYNDLTDDQKNLVTDETLNKLIAAETVIANREGAKAVEDMINALPDAKDITLADKDAVNAANEARLNLPPEQADYLTLAAIDKLFKAMDKIEDLEAAKAVTDQINALPTVIILEDKADVEAARAAYNDLTDDQKALVDEEALDKLADAEKVIADREAAKVVDDQISALPDQITADTLEQFSQAYAGYLGLTYTQANYLSPDNKAIADSLFSIILIYRGVTENIPDQVTLDDKAFVNNLNTFYDGSSELVKSYIPEDVVQKLKDAAKTVNDLQSAADVEALIEALPSATDVTLDDKEQIDEAGAAYEALTDEQKELVPVDSRIKLGAVQIALALVEKDAADKAAAAEVTELIEALPSATSVAPWDAEDIEAARAAYDALTDDQKALVSTQNKLKLLLVEAALPIAIDNAAAEEVEELIEALPNAAQVTVDDKDAIEEASDAYDALTAGQKQLVKLADRLKLQNVKTALEQAIDEAAADAVEAMIEDLPDAAQVTVLDKEAVDAAAEAYDNLTDNQKKLVLLADRVKLAAVKAALENAEDIAAADAVEELIEALPNAADVTVDDEEAIDAAGAAYNALTDNQKKLVVLADRIKLQNVQNALAKAINDAEAAQKVTDQINALPDGEDVTFDDLRDIAAARVAYTLLTPDQKALVPEETLNKLVVDEAVIAEIIPAEAVKVAINSLPAPEDLKLADKDLVEAVREAYEDLTDYQKALIDEDTLAKLTDAEAAIEAIEADKAVADAVAEQIKALPSPISVTIDDKDEIEAVKAAYDELTDAQKDLVSAADKLKLAAVLIALDTAEKIAEDEAAADAVEALIEALPDAADVTVDDEEAIDAAGAAYNALTDDQKRMVVLADRIKLQNVQNALAKAINDAEAAQKVIDQINALPEAEDITLDDLKDVAAATLAYALLTHDQKQLVDEDTRAKLTAAQDALDDLFEVEGVKAMINALPDAEDVTINDKPYIEAVRENYDALTDAQKALIDDDTYAKLTDAEDALEAIEEDIAAAQEVSEQIKALPSALRVTVDDKDDIEAAKEAYDALTDAQKAFVPTADKLKLAAVLGALDAAEKFAEDEAAADAVEEMIEALPDPADVTIEDKDDIDAAVEAYNALTDDQKRLVVLADRIKLALDDAALQKIENDIAAAEAVTEQIEALPEAEDVTIEDFDDIVAARAAYNALTDDQKALVDEDTLAKLADDEAALADAIEVEFVKALINELPAPEDVTIDDAFFIEAVRDWYDELSDAQKDMIDEETYQKLVDAEEALAALTKFTVTWMNGDEVLEVDTDLPSGATPHYDGETPTKATDDQYVYEFMGWDPDLALVTADVTYNAVFDTYLIGDVNMDGTVDIFDAVEVQKYASGKEPLTELQLRIADINKDGNVDILDASAIQRITSQ